MCAIKGKGEVKLSCT